MIGSILLFVICGFVLEALICQYTICSCRGKALSAMFLSVIITALNLWVIVEVVPERKIALIIAYLIGVGLGTYITVKINSKEK
jgi:uncharacterized protein YebE (UPF0316 family)